MVKALFSILVKLKQYFSFNKNKKCSKDHNALISNLEHKNNLIKKQDQKISNLEESEHLLSQEIEKYKRKLELSKLHNLDKKLLHKYPSKLITWNARSLPFSKQKIKVPVNLMITPNDPLIIADLKKWGFWGSSEDYEILIPKIYKKIHREYYHYKHDGPNWGSPEVWAFVFEIREKGWIDDCDGFGVVIVSYLRALGVPAGFCWCVAGDTSIFNSKGEPMGHLSCYIYSQESKKFHHLNSTFGLHSHYETLSEYPTHDDATESNDKIGIAKVWFSFNDLVARSEFNKKEIGEILIE